MKRIARVVTRPLNSDHTECDLIIGTMTRGNSSALKGSTIYDVVDCLGVIQLIEVGESLLSSTNYKESPIGVTWFEDVSDLVVSSGKFLLVTRNEYAELKEKGIV